MLWCIAIQDMPPEYWGIVTRRRQVGVRHQVLMCKTFCMRSSESLGHMISICSHLSERRFDHEVYRMRAPGQDSALMLSIPASGGFRCILTHFCNFALLWNCFCYHFVFGSNLGDQALCGPWNFESVPKHCAGIVRNGPSVGVKQCWALCVHLRHMVFDISSCDKDVRIIL